MRSVLQSFKQRWGAYSPQERWILLSLGGAGVLIVVWLYVWQPLAERHEQAHMDLQAAQDSVEWLRRAAPQLRTAGSVENQQPEDVQSMTNLVSQAASEHNLSLSRFEQSGADGLRFWLDDQPFEPVLLWVAMLESRGVVMDQVTISQTSAPGAVNVRGVLVRRQ